MMDNRKRCDGVGALFCVLGDGNVDKIRAFSSVFVYFEGRAGQLRWNSCESGGEGGVQRTLLRTRGEPKHTANAVRLRAQAGFSTSHVSSRLVIRLLKRRYHKQIRDAALHFHETKKHVGKFQRAF